MHKILKKTIKYTACGIGVLLLAIILFVSILYFSADMLTPDYTPKANGELVQTDAKSYLLTIILSFSASSSYFSTVI